MNLTYLSRRCPAALTLGWVLVLGLGTPGLLRADESFAKVSHDASQKVVKIFGAGGFAGITNYCTGVLVAPDSTGFKGHILTVYSATLDTQLIRIHLADGTQMTAKLIAAEPQLDTALLQIEDAEKLKLELPHFDLSKPFPEVQPGDRILALSNLFEIATGPEPVSVQRGVIAAVAPSLQGRRGMHEAPYKGPVYILDAITNNPGSHGGAIVTRRGELVGLIGKELRNTLTETWVNYAMPVKDLVKFVQEGVKGNYKPKASVETKIVDKGARHGIVMVQDLFERTPPYIEEVMLDSPAHKSGLKPDDLVVMLRVPAGEDGFQEEEKFVSSVKSFRDTICQVDPGRTIKITVRRGTQLLRFDMTLEKSK